LATETVSLPPEGTVVTRPIFSSQFLWAELKRHKYFAVATLLVLLAGAIGLTYFIRKQNKTTVGPSRTKSIAVLPFKPFNSTIRDEIYEIGIADALIHRLSSIDGLVVRPLSATRHYKGTALDWFVAGKEQKVDYVLSSSYQLRGSKIYVSSRLFDVATKVVEVTYQSEKEAANVFAVQDAVADELGNMLMTRFRTTTGRAEAKRGTTSEEAYRLYLQAMYLYAKRNERASRRAIELLDQAVSLDPNYAWAWAGKAHAHRYAANLGRDTDIHSEYKQSMEAINRALSLNKDLSEAHSALCENKYYYEFDFAGAETACQRAVALDPNSSLAHEIYGRFLYHQGRFPEGIKEMEMAVDLEPASLFNQRNLGIALYYAGLYDKAKAQFKRLITMDASFASAYSWLRNSAEMQGNYAEAFDWFLQAQGVLGADWQTIQLYKRIYQKSGYHAVLREYVERFDGSINQYYVGAVLHAYIGNKDKAFEYLEIAYQRREWGLNSLLIERRLDPIRDDPRFAGLVSRVGLK
jgi:TolB-like protein/Tfp pilus assembly protein PilF